MRCLQGHGWSVKQISSKWDKNEQLGSYTAYKMAYSKSVFHITLELRCDFTQFMQNILYNISNIIQQVSYRYQVSDLRTQSCQNEFFIRYGNINVHFLLKGVLSHFIFLFPRLTDDADVLWRGRNRLRESSRK